MGFQGLSWPAFDELYLWVKSLQSFLDCFLLEHLMSTALQKTKVSSSLSIISITYDQSRANEKPERPGAHLYSNACTCTRHLCALLELCVACDYAFEVGEKHDLAFSVTKNGEVPDVLPSLDLTSTRGEDITRLF